MTAKKSPLLKLSASALKVYKDCPRKYYFQYILKPPIEKKEAPHLDIGNFVHHVLEAFHNTTMDGSVPQEEWNALLSKICKEQVSKWPKLTKDNKVASKEMLKNYLGIIKEATPDVLSNEQSFSIMLDENTLIRGFIDRIDRDPERGYNIVDYKGLALDTPIPTPNGWTTMGELKVGDYVFGSDGKPTLITVKSGIHNRPCYKITFNDQSEVVCDNIHLWDVDLIRKNSEVRYSGVIDADELYDRFCTEDGRAYGEFVIHHPLSISDEHLKILGFSSMSDFIGKGEYSIIHKMEKVISVPTQCISVDAEDSIYLCGPKGKKTHNTGKSKYLDEFQLLIYGIYLLDQYPEVENFKGSYICLAENAKVLPYNFTRTDVERCKADIVATAQKIREDQTWEMKPQFLCSYCDYEKICPAMVNGNRFVRGASKSNNDWTKKSTGE